MLYMRWDSGVPQTLIKDLDSVIEYYKSRNDAAAGILYGRGSQNVGHDYTFGGFRYIFEYFFEIGFTFVQTDSHETAKE